VGWATTLGGGLALGVTRAFGLAVGYQLDYAPVIENLAGDTHASGGHRLSASASYTY
jgi:hypothetical protein